MALGSTKPLTEMQKVKQSHYRPWQALRFSMQCACTVLLTLPHFFTLKGHDFRKSKRLLKIKCVTWFSLQTFYDTFYILRRNERDMVTNFVGLQRNTRYSCPIKKLNFLDWFWKRIMISIFVKILPVGAEFFYADRRTDRYDEADSRLSQFWECL
jgi:hypothetical protein